jgi:TolA-binding protein
MTRVVDLHPEELLERDARGELSAADASRLEAHLGRCPACRLERQLRADFADELASDAPCSPSSVERLAIAGAAAPNPPSIRSARPARHTRSGRSATRSPVPTPPTDPLSVPMPARTEISLPPLRYRRRPVTRAAWLLAAAAVFAVSVAGATGAGQRVWDRFVGSPPPAAAPPADEESAPSHVAAKHAARHLTPPAPSAVSEPRPEPSTVDVLVSSAPLSPPAHPMRPGPIVRPATETEGAASLFAAATEQRRQGSYARAIQLQRELLAKYPHSRESHVARETMGRLLLDRGDPAGAFASFDAYLSEGSGELGEEAMVGRATALERLDRSADAANAWRGLLAAYPETPYAAHARSRLGSLSVR